MLWFERRLHLQYDVPARAEKRCDKKRALVNNSLKLLDSGQSTLVSNYRDLWVRDESMWRPSSRLQSTCVRNSHTRNYFGPRDVGVRQQDLGSRSIIKLKLLCSEAIRDVPIYNLYNHSPLKNHDGLPFSVEHFEEKHK